MSEADFVLMHGSCVAVADRAVLILGASGSGKSGLALQMIALGAILVADDGVQLARIDTKICARAPRNLAGLIEARGIGILSMVCRQDVPVGLVVDLDASAGARMPDPQKFAVFGDELPLISGKDVPNLASALMVKLAQAET